MKFNTKNEKQHKEPTQKTKYTKETKKQHRNKTKTKWKTTQKILKSNQKANTAPQNTKTKC